MLKRTIELAAYAHGFSLDTPFEKFPQRIQNLILYGYPPSNERSPTGPAIRSRREKGSSRKRVSLSRGF